MRDQMSPSLAEFEGAVPWTGRDAGRNARLVYVATKDTAAANHEGWKAATLLVSIFLFAVFFLLLLFIFLWASSAPPPCPPVPVGPKPFPPGIPPAFPTPELAAFSSSAGGCRFARPAGAAQVFAANQSDRSAALYYVAGERRFAGVDACAAGATFAAVPATFPLEPGSTHHLATYDGAELEVYVFDNHSIAPGSSPGNIGTGTAVPCFVDGAAPSSTFMIPGPGGRATLSVVGTAATGYSVFVQTTQVSSCA